MSEKRRSAGLDETSSSDDHGRGLHKGTVSVISLPSPLPLTPFVGFARWRDAGPRARPLGGHRPC